MAQAAVAVASVRHSPWPRLSSIFSSGKHPQHIFFSVARALKPLAPQALEGDGDGEPDAPAVKKSRNELKREARRAVKWGMELASFSNPQIKRVLRIASVEREVFDALMLVKRLGPDVREGRRRQFNYIGRLLRQARPDLMDALIQASKDGDNDRLLALAGPQTLSDENGEEEEEEDIYREEAVYDTWASIEVSKNHAEIATKWFDGLVDKDALITKEVYSIHNVEFDRQELRKLVRRVQSIREGILVDESGFMSSQLNGVDNIGNQRKQARWNLFSQIGMTPKYNRLWLIEKATLSEEHGGVNTQVVSPFMVRVLVGQFHSFVTVFDSTELSVGLGYNWYSLYLTTSSWNLTASCSPGNSLLRSQSLCLTVSHNPIAYHLPRRAADISSGVDEQLWSVLSNAGDAALSTTGFALETGQSKSLDAPAGWSGRLWARTLCATDSYGRFSCRTGDCGSGKVECSGGGATPPVSLAEFTPGGGGGGGMDYHDVSLVDGYNLPMLVVVAARSSSRGSEGVACMSACEAFGSPQYCCSGAYGNPNTCMPSSFSQFFKNACPKAYSYAFDDATSTFTCASADYRITFCPITASQKSSSQNPESSAGAQLSSSDGDGGAMEFVGGDEFNGASPNVAIRAAELAVSLAILVSSWLL
ncbi:hypothetical protein OPV22_002448 [Ensete ventricosum]|uniref:Thaumatin-like protein n=1 Tax=Ensete ventricosum TaxID=4639 RepID=A0AAV8RY07_ENSVE|nr:hypothetical protein OPV22_002448 [Ensete ventricosum]